MTKKLLQMWGPHLMVEGYGCPSEDLNSMDIIYELLDELPAAINMNKMTRPSVVKQRKPTDIGVTGFVLIEESHISIHTFPAHNYFTLDIYSCSDFEKEKALSFVQNKLKATHMEHSLIYRGDSRAKAKAVKAHLQ